MKTQKEWHKLATKVGEKLFAKQEKLFNGMTDVLYYCQEVSRFDTFVKVSVSVHFKNYECNEEAIELDEAIGSYSDNIYLDDYTEDNKLDEFFTSVNNGLKEHHEKVKQYREDHKQNK